MTTRPMIRTRPGAGFIAILATLAILNVLSLAAACSSDRNTAAVASPRRAAEPPLTSH